jgi:hypothetical protein
MRARTSLSNTEVSAQVNVVRTFLVTIAFAALASSAQAQQVQVVGYAGVLGEWELTATVTETGSQRAREFSGPLLMTHVGLCTQDEPERQTGEIRFQISSSRLDATLSFAGSECTYSAALSEAYKGSMTCPGRPAVPLTLFVR